MSAKQDLINQVSEKTELSKKDSGLALDAITNSIKDSLAKDESVQIMGFGTFETRQRAEREGRNPQTGEKITIKATKIPAFKPGKELKNAVN